MHYYMTCYGDTVLLIEDKRIILKKIKLYSIGCNLFYFHTTHMIEWNDTWYQALRDLV